MISLKAFVTAIHNAVFSASGALMDRNYEQFSNYFTEVKPSGTVGDTTDSDSNIEKHLSPKMVRLDYPNNTESSSNNEKNSVMVPLITLVPFSACQVEKVTLTTDFKTSVDQNDELQLDFSKTKKWGDKSHTGKLEIIVSPINTPEGLQQLIEGYENLLRRQL